MTIEPKRAAEKERWQEMIANGEYDLARVLGSALKARSPYVGVPLPGHAPLIFRRDLLQRSLRGVRVVDVRVITGEDQNGDAGRYLVVDGTAEERWDGKVLLGRVRHHMKVRSIPRREILYVPTDHSRTWDRWLESERKALGAGKGQGDGNGTGAAPSKPSGKHLKAIAALERKLEKLGSRPQIYNPAVAVGARVSDYEREVWLRWKRERELRGKIGAVARQAKDSRELYAGLRGLGLEKVRKFSELGVWERRILAGGCAGGTYQHRSEGTYFDFARPENLWRFQAVGGSGWSGWVHRSRPGIGVGDYLDPNRWGVGRYATVLEWSRERQELLSQIEAVRAMMEDVRERKAGKAGKPKKEPAA